MKMFLQVDFISSINEFWFNEIVQGMRALITGLLDDDCWELYQIDLSIIFGWN